MKMIKVYKRSGIERMDQKFLVTHSHDTRTSCQSMKLKGSNFKTDKYFPLTMHNYSLEQFVTGYH